MEQRGGKILTHLSATKTRLMADRVHLTNIVFNLIDNAIKYSIESPKIEISTENVNDLVIIKIKDSGIGMSKVAQKRIFEKFYREHTGDLHNVKDRKSTRLNSSHRR